MRRGGFSLLPQASLPAPRTKLALPSFPATRLCGRRIETTSDVGEIRTTAARSTACAAAAPTRAPRCRPTPPRTARRGIDDTIDRILDPEPDTEATRLRSRLEHELRQCDKQIAKCRALLDDDVDLATVSSWLKEAIANRQIAERRLDELCREATSTLADRVVVREAVTKIVD